MPLKTEISRTNMGKRNNTAESHQLNDVKTVYVWPLLTVLQMLKKPM